MVTRPSAVGLAGGSDSQNALSPPSVEELREGAGIDERPDQFGSQGRPAPEIHRGRVRDCGRTASARIDGLAHARARLQQLIQRKKEHPDERFAVVLDLDNTLFDTRARTLEICRAWDASRDEENRRFRGLTLGKVRATGAETWDALTLPETERAEFAAHWDREFWRGDNFLSDLLIQNVADLVEEARGAGIEILYLTGRVDFDATVRQLEAFGLPTPDREHVFTKPDIDTKTGPFKVEKILEWLHEGIQLGWFMTESRRDIGLVQEALQLEAPELLENHLCLRVAHPLERTSETPIAKDTPSLPMGHLKRPKLMKHGSQAAPEISSWLGSE